MAGKEVNLPKKHKKNTDGSKKAKRCEFCLYTMYESNLSSLLISEKLTWYRFIFSINLI